MNTQELRNQLDNASNVLIVLPYLIDTDAVSSTALIYKLLSSKDKKTTIASSNPIDKEGLEILKMAGVEDSDIVRHIDPISYVLSVANIHDKVNVSWKRNDSNLDLVLIPERGEVDFSDISFSRQGGTYDLVIIINSTKGDHLGSIYTQNQGLFATYKVIGIGKDLTLEDEQKPSLTFEGYSSTSETIFDSYEELGGELDKNIAEITAMGLIGKTDGLQLTKSPKTFEVLSILSNRFGVDVDQLFRKYHASFSKDELFVEERVIRNIKVDEGRKVIYSVMTVADFNGLNYNSNNFNPVKYLPRNIKGDYKYAFVAFEKALNQSEIFIKTLSSDVNITDVTEKINAYPNTNSAFAKFSTNVATAINAVLNAIAGEETYVKAIVETQPQVQPGQESFKEDEGVAAQPQSAEPIIQQELIPEANTEIAEPESIQTEVIQPVPEEPSTPPIQPPFVRANEFAVDPNAEAMKKSNYFSSTERPFDASH